LGEFFGNALERDGFIAFTGPEKRGKTFLLLDVAWTAIQQNRKVVFFEVGDMSQNQIMRRFAVRASRRPLDPCIVRYPTFIEREDGDGLAKVDFKDRTFKKHLTDKLAWESFKQLSNKINAGKETLLRLSVHPNDSISILGVRSILQQ